MSILEIDAFKEKAYLETCYIRTNRCTNNPSHWSIPVFQKWRDINYMQNQTTGICLAEFWRNAEELFLNLARKAKINVSFVSNSVDVEKCFFSYGYIFTEHQSIKMLKFNSKI